MTAVPPAVARRIEAIRGVLLDKDGTLIDYARTWVPINREAALMAAAGDAGLAGELLALGGHDPASDRITPGSVLAAGTHDEIAAVFARRLGGLAPPDLAARVAAVFRDGGARHAVAVPGAAEACASLAARGLVLGVATNDSGAGMAASLARSGLAGHFRFAVGCDDGHGVKPAPGMAAAFAAWAGMAPAEVAVVGDAVHDLEMGRRAGCGLLVGVLSGTSGRDDLAPLADLLIESVRDLPGLWRAA